MNCCLLLRNLILQILLVNCQLFFLSENAAHTTMPQH